jgi:Fic family protein
MKSFTDQYLGTIQLTPQLFNLTNALSEYRGKEELYEKQSPETLHRLLEAAKVESTESSNRIEGIEVAHKRVEAIVIKNSQPRNRPEQEVSGYRDALDRIHTTYTGLPVSLNTILLLHEFLYKHTETPGGSFKREDNLIVDRLKDGTARERFRPVAAALTYDAMKHLVDNFNYLTRQSHYSQLLLIPLFILDFLCIHPFSDGNGRVARLLTLLLLYHAGYNVGKYIGLERIIEQSKETYYEALEKSSNGWHDGAHDAKPWQHYFYGTLLAAYKEFEQRVGIIRRRSGNKRAQLIETIREYNGKFSISNLEVVCPNISRDMIRKVLRELRDQGLIKSDGFGRNAKWFKTGKL